MNLVMANEYATRQYDLIPKNEDALGKIAVSKALMVNLLANAFIDGCICVIKDQLQTSRMPICEPITATVSQPESKEWTRTESVTP